MNWRKTISIVLMAVVAVGVVAFALPGVVSAQAPQPTTTPPAAAPQANGANVDARLEKLYQAELKMLDNQSKIFTRVSNLTATANNLIAQAKANGKDVSALEAGLATFTTQVGDAQKIHDQAAALIQAHVGFDANGKVTDRMAARDTVQNGRDLLRDVRQAVAKAIQNFHKTIRDWRQAQKTTA